MAVNYKVKAFVVDITKDKPKSCDLILVDTNCWYWQTYSRASLRNSPPSQHQTASYPPYIDLCLGAGSTLLRCVHTLTEMMHLVETAEWEIFAQQHNLTKLTLKEFRHSGSANLSAFRKEISSCWSQIEGMTTFAGHDLSEECATEFMKSIPETTVDGFDLLLRLMMKNASVERILTDDGDLATCEGIIVHTANRRVISAALNAGRLLPARV